MPVINSMDVQMTTDEVLESLPLSTPAFSTRPAPELISEILHAIEEDRLLEPKASYAIHDICRLEGPRLEVKGGSFLSFERVPDGIDDADRLVAAAWSLGSRVSTVISDAFSQRNFLNGFLLHEITSLLLFRLGEKLFDQLSGESSGPDMNIGRVLAPGDNDLALQEQASVLDLARGGRIGVELSRSGALFPALSATAVALMGRRIQPPRFRWSCKQCRARETCRLSLKYENC